MSYILVILTIAFACAQSYFLGTYYSASKWEKKYWHDMNMEIPFESLRTSYGGFRVLLIILICIGEIVVQIVGSFLKGTKYTTWIITGLYFILLAVFWIIFDRISEKRDKKRYYPTGKLLKTSISPQGTYEIKAYLINDEYVRCEILKIPYAETRNIYWDFCQDVSIEWDGNDFVLINGNRLNAEKDYYDSRIHPLRSSKA